MVYLVKTVSSRENVHFHKSSWLPSSPGRAQMLNSWDIQGFRKQKAFIFTSPFWLPNSRGGHKQNKNDTSLRFHLFNVVCMSCGHGTRRARLKEQSSLAKPAVLFCRALHQVLTPRQYTHVRTRDHVSTLRVFCRHLRTRSRVLVDIMAFVMPAQIGGQRQGKGRA